ncbi:DUF262 domain-containing protein [Sorangium sp. So ce134]
MNVSTTFDSTKEQLSDVLASIRAGKTQLPDFQRGWVWDDEHIRSLLASISRSFPVGAVMMLQTGNPNVRFKPRPVEGAPAAIATEPERLILDGQQRLTSLYQSLFSGQPANTRDARGNPIRRWYYVHIPTALDRNADREDAIIVLPEDRLNRNFRGEVTRDYSSIEQECAAELLPLPLVFDVAGLTAWQMKYLSADPSRMADRLARWNELVPAVIQPFQQYQVPLIILRKETPKEAVCQVFEKVNTGGVALTVFDLLTATYAADNFNLREDWDARVRRLRHHPVLRSVENTDLLQAVTLLATYARRTQGSAARGSTDAVSGISCKRKDVLQLSLDDYRKWVEPVTVGFEKAAKFLYTQRFFAARDLPYRTQLVPLAASLALLGDDSEKDGVKTKLARWFWCGVFGELYGSAIESRFAKDLGDIVAWVQGGPEPTTVMDATFAPSRLLTLRTRNSAAYKGLYALLLLDGGLDFRTGDAVTVQNYFDEKIDIHHIFPKKWCSSKGIDRKRYDSIVNKTALSSRTNRMIGANAPSAYLPKLEKHAGISVSRMDDILRSHVIDPMPLRVDNFDRFFEARERALLQRVEMAMGKPARADFSAPAVDVEPFDEEDDEE